MTQRERRVSEINCTNQFSEIADQNTKWWWNLTWNRLFCSSMSILKLFLKVFKWAIRWSTLLEIKVDKFNQNPLYAKKNLYTIEKDAYFLLFYFSFLSVRHEPIYGLWSKQFRNSYYQSNYYLFWITSFSQIGFVCCN